MNPHFPILREPIKVRLVHGPTSWILGDDSPITSYDQRALSPPPLRSDLKSRQINPNQVEQIG
ncbi:unnamed protein product [Penicillium camemberti]|uniref:Str. FM013 n=1 Tax=Penicillium camemberti (strain FM 013) TaxID=1429867 RepID=A0A0G4PR94_PENC3|nr:unnamed protein product [Penicillium camemberti]